MLLPFITESALALNKQKELGLVVEPFEPIASGQSEGMWGPEVSLDDTCKCQIRPQT